MKTQDKILSEKLKIENQVKDHKAKLSVLKASHDEKRP